MPARPAHETPDTPTRPVIHWDDDGSFSLVPDGWVEETVTPLEALAAAGTWGEARAATGSTWLEAALECAEERAEDDGTDTSDHARFDAATAGMGEAELIEFAPVPWDAEVLFEWFPPEDRDLIDAHCRIEGASPGGNIDGYSPDDLTEFLTALGERGYTVVHLPVNALLLAALEKLG